MTTVHDLIRADLGDSRRDGFLTPGQLRNLGPAFQGVVREKSLADPEGRLPYQHYLNVFERAKGAWREITSRPEEIPLTDALRLGKKIGELKQKVGIRLEDRAGRPLDIIRRLRAPTELYVAMLNAMTPTAPSFQGDGLGKQVEFSPVFDRYITDEPLRSAFEKDLLTPQGTSDPQTIYRRAAARFLDRLDTLPDGSKELMYQRVWNVPVFEELPTAPFRGIIEGLYAALAYRAVYFFPAIDARVWGGMIRSIALLDSESFTTPPAGKNPFAHDSLVTPPLPNHYSCTTKKITLRPGMKQTAHTTPLRMTPLIDEIQFTMISGTPCGDQADQTRDLFLFNLGQLIAFRQLIEYFQTLSGDDYRDLFPETKTTPRQAARSQFEVVLGLANFANRGGDFPERVRQRLEAKGRWQPEKIAAIYQKLSTLRHLLKNTVGYEGAPRWAEKAR